MSIWVNLIHKYGELLATDQLNNSDQNITAASATWYVNTNFKNFEPVRIAELEKFKADGPSESMWFFFW